MMYKFNERKVLGTKSVFIGTRRPIGLTESVIE